MPAETYDLVVIGGGPAGEKAAAQAAFWGRSVALVDRGPVPGGAMVGGAIASKTMREAALYLTGFEQRDVYRVGLGLTPEFATERLRDRTDDVVALSARRVAENLRRHRVIVLDGQARLLAGRRVLVDLADGTGEVVLAATTIVLATGSRPFHPPGVPFDHPDVLDSDEAALVGRPLSSLVVVGGGAVGCEFASIFTALGADVVLVDSRARLLPFLDAEIASALEDAFVAMGMRVVHQSGHADVAASEGEGVSVRLPDGEVLSPEKVIVATGRTGNVEGLGLEEMGVATDSRGLILVDERYRTSVDGIVAVGDVIGPPALASVSMEQARHAVRWALDLPLQSDLDDVPPYGVYSVPEAAMVGRTEEAAAADGIACAVGRAEFRANTRAAVSGVTTGLLKLVFRRDDLRLLGVHILGPAATELIHLGQAVLHAGGSIDYFVNATFNVPTLTEAYKYAAYDGLSAVGR